MNLRSYFDRPRPLNDVTGLTEKPPLQVTWTLGAGAPRKPRERSTLSKSGSFGQSGSLGKAGASLSASSPNLGARPAWNSSCFFELGSENNAIQHDAQRKYFIRAPVLPSANRMADRIYPTGAQDSIHYRG